VALAASRVRLLLPPLLLLLLLVAPCSGQPPPPAPPSPLRAVITDVGAFNFSASLRASSPGSVAYVVWLASDAAVFGAPAASDVREGLGSDGLRLAEGRAGSVLVVRAARRAASAVPRGS
jgi:hypothetical protein